MINCKDFTCIRKALGLTVYRLQISLWSNNLTNVIYFIIRYILNDTVLITGPFCVIFKTFCLNVINYFILKELIFLCFSNKSYFAPQKLMHTPASRQPGASYTRKATRHTKNVLGMPAHVVTKPSLATSGQLTIMHNMFNKAVYEYSLISWRPFCNRP